MSGTQLVQLDLRAGWEQSRVECALPTSLDRQFAANVVSPSLASRTVVFGFFVYRSRILACLMDFGFFEWIQDVDCKRHGLTISR